MLIGGPADNNQAGAAWVFVNATAAQPTLTVVKGGSGSGSVSSSPAGIDCGSTCSYAYDAGTSVTLTATADAGSRFAGWSGGCSGTGTCTVTMGSDQTVTATFIRQHTLAVVRSGSGSGPVSSSPVGIDCGSTCSYAFDSGTSVTLTATPVAGSRFAGWSGSGCSGTGTCTVTMDSDQTVTATFIAQHTLTVAKTGAGSGSVTSSPPGIDCGSTCSSAVDSGTQVTLTATPATGSRFAGWSGGGCSGTGTCTVSMSSDETVTATFDVSTVPGLVVTVVDDSHHPVVGADLLLIDSAGDRYTGTSDSAGIAVLQGVPDGTYTVSGYESGYRPGTASVTVQGGNGQATITLTVGQVAIAQLLASAMTYAQMIAAGIDPNNPDNQHAFQFEAHLANTPIQGYTVAGATGSGSFAGTFTVDGAPVPCGASGCTFSVGGYQVNLTVQYVDDEPQLLWLVIPGKATWLKEFFDVHLLVSNLADSSFTLDHGSAKLTLPQGLSLASTATAQSATDPVPDIPGGGSGGAEWVLSGDKEGLYNLTASYRGRLSRSRRRSRSRPQRPSQSTCGVVRG